jgi:hypothetical protein
VRPTFRPREPGGRICECGEPVNRHVWHCNHCGEPFRGFWGGFRDQAWMADAQGHRCLKEQAPKLPDAGPGYATLYCPRPTLRFGRRPSR